MPISTISSLFMHKFLGTVLLCSWLSLLVPMFLVTTIYPRDILELCAPSETAQQFTHHSSSSEVRLVFFATDEQNRHIESIHRDDFAVLDNGWVIRNFRSFAHAGLIKLDVVVLVDASDSVRPRFHKEIDSVLNLISQWPWSPGDNVSVLSFRGMEPQLVCDGNCRTWFTSDHVDSLANVGATPLFDAVTLASGFLNGRRRPDVWPVMIVFSDGNDTISKASFTSALKKVMAGEEQIYAIDLGNATRPSQGTTILQRMAESSGGRFLPFSDGADRILSEVMDDLHSGLLVTYALPESASEFHSVRILPTHNLHLQFRCRRGYYRPFSDRVRQEDVP
jgi:Ca-activated chloride channel homolog